MGHKLTPDVKKRLQEFADRITPPNQEPGGRPGKALTADELKERYGLTTDSKGQPLKPGQLYLAKDLPAVNHQRRLCKAYERGGWAEVEQYLQPYRTPAAIARAICARADAQAAKATAEVPEGEQPGEYAYCIAADDA